ncbi:guanine nucleotide exchange protein for ADP-robosylation factor, partial [Nowakowskiella sp. JEL0078]
DEENISIMHAFVDEMEFTTLEFTEALRMFLQSFRLPGESQKIDRFMLKFAERYLKHNPGSFSSADTAYILAYSVIMLNTDQHNTQVKKRMTKQDFMKNNRGIDEGKDLEPAFLERIFDEINSNEIIMKDEHPGSGATTTNNVSPARSPSNVPISSAGDSLNDDVPARFRRKDVSQFSIASETMAFKTETMFNTLMKTTVSGSRKSIVNSAQHSREGSMDGLASMSASSSGWVAASQYEHVRGMFQTVWMAILTGISAPLQETEDMEVIMLALEGFKLATRVACLFDSLELERKAFLSQLAKFTQFAAVGSNLQDVKAKNLEAVKTLLEIAHLDGNSLGENWKDVVTCVSQLEKLQLLGGAEGDVTGKQRQSSERTRRESHQGNRGAGGRYLDEAAAEASSQSMTLAVDRLFTSSVKLSGPAIVAFVKALSQISWDEITSSAGELHPRMYCLQRLVEVSYFNMRRIRMEWSQIWAIMGEHFNKVGSLHTPASVANNNKANSTVAFFALDKLRQLAMKFLELEELPNFKFQKDFLKPFEIILSNNPDVKIKDMVLVCLQQFIQAKAKSMRSGWKTMFSTFQRAAKENHEPVVLLSFDILKSIFKTHFDSVIINGTFPDFVSCLVEFCKNRKFPKTSLHAIELLRQSITRVGELIKTTDKFIVQANPLVLTPNANTVATAVGEQNSNGVQMSVNSSQKGHEDDPNYKFWFPVLFGLYEIIMTCDLEVRTRGLTYLFDTLKTFGGHYQQDFWEVVSKGVLFPIFDDLRISKREHSKFSNKEDMSVWLSTTMIQALRLFIDLFAVYFDALRFLVDGLLDLLSVCITQENETLARIGSTCLQQFIENNVSKINNEEWDKICIMFIKLFSDTTPNALFFDISDSEPEKIDETQSPTRRSRPEKKDFQQIIVKCVLHLLVIQTLSEVLTTSGSNNESSIQGSDRSGSDSQPRRETAQPQSQSNATAIVYSSLSCKHLFELLDCLEQSYRFAQKFNANLELRMQLYKMGFMKQLPNLLRQETSSVSTYILVLVKMHGDQSLERRQGKPEVDKRLIPLCHDILQEFNSLDPESKRRNVNAWRPVVVTILNALVDFDDESFKEHIVRFYPEVVNLLLQELTPDIRNVLHSLLIRAGIIFGVIDVNRSVGGSLSRSFEFEREESVVFVDDDGGIAPELESVVIETVVHSTSVESTVVETVVESVIVVGEETSIL